MNTERKRVPMLNLVSLTVLVLEFLYIFLLFLLVCLFAVLSKHEMGNFPFLH